MYENRDEFIWDLITKAKDKNYLIKPQLDWADSGNGVFYTALAMVLTRDIFGKDSPVLNEMFLHGVKQCMPTPGLLLRTPDNAYGQEQWDNMMGLAIGCGIAKNTEIPRQVLKYGLRHLFFFDTDGKGEAKDFLGRFPQIWALMLPAAFPKLKALFWPFAWLVYKFMKMPDKGNASGINLVYMYCAGLDYLYRKRWYLGEFVTQLWLKHDILMEQVFEQYFGRTHPFTLAERTYIHE